MYFTVIYSVSLKYKNQTKTEELWDSELKMDLSDDMDIPPLMCMEDETKGYVVFKRVIKQSVIDAVLKCAANRRMKWRKVFLNDVEYDDHRLMRLVKHTEPAIQEVLKEVIPLRNVAVPHTRLGECTLLKSLPGGQDQAPHRDYQLDREMYFDFTYQHASVIAALQDVSRVALYGWNTFFAAKERERVIEMTPGDVLIFRGDQIHRGLSYPKENIRLHFSLLGLKNTFEGDTTNHVPWKRYVCRRCFVEEECANSLSAHLKKCKVFRCDMCNHIDESSDLILKHKLRTHGVNW